MNDNDFNVFGTENDTDNGISFSRNGSASTDSENGVNGVTGGSGVTGENGGDAPRNFGETNVTETPPFERHTEYGESTSYYTSPQNTGSTPSDGAPANGYYRTDQNARGFSAANPYPAANAGRRQKAKKPPTRRTLVVFGVITLVLSLVFGTVSGVVSSFVAVKVITGDDGSAITTTQHIDELISVPTEANAELPTSAEEPTAAPSAEENTTVAASQNSESKKTKGEVYAESVDSIVGIKCEGTKEVSSIFGRSVSAAFTSTGSGFFISSDGYIVTNYHVIENATKITVTTYAGQAYDAEVRGSEPSNDIAVIKVSGEFTPVKQGDSSSLAVGDDILVIGNALGELSYTFTDGVVSYLNRAVTTESGNAINMFQTNAAINEGNSGGPVLDMYGNVVGIASAKYEASSVEGLGFFIPINDIKSMISDIIANGYVSGKPSLGISVQPVTQTMSLRYAVPVGLYIVAVGSDTAASKAGLKAADVITAVDGSSVTGVAELSSALSSKRAGDTLSVTVSRSGAAATFTLTLDEYTPADPRTEYTGVYDY